jgi:Fe-S-cluster containining protein
VNDQVVSTTQDRSPLRDGLRLWADEKEKYLSLVAVTRALMDVLGTQSPVRASDTAVLSHALLERSIVANPPPQQPACRKGCSHCCRIYVSATAPEIFVLAQAIRALPADQFAATRARIRTASAATQRDWARDIFFTYPCPLLEEGACSVHPQRPDSCRGLSSFSAEACAASIAALAWREDKEIPQVQEHMFLRGLHAHTLWAALKGAGLPFETFSLNQALDAALDMPDAEARWLAGENVLKDVPRDTSLEGRDLLMVTATMDSLIAGANGEVVVE